MPALIAFLVSALRVMLLARAGMFIARILTFFGLTWATNEYAVEPALDFIESMMNTGPGGELGAKVMAWAGVLRLDTAVSMILSAYSAAWTIKSAKVFLMKTS